jgi:DNA-binding IclR family transcriptional regulator
MDAYAPTVGAGDDGALALASQVSRDAPDLKDAADSTCRVTAAVVGRRRAYSPTATRAPLPVSSRTPLCSWSVSAWVARALPPRLPSTAPLLQSAARPLRRRRRLRPCR